MLWNKTTTFYFDLFKAHKINFPKNQREHSEISVEAIKLKLRIRVPTPTIKHRYKICLSNKIKFSNQILFGELNYLTKSVPLNPGSWQILWDHPYNRLVGT